MEVERLSTASRVGIEPLATCFPVDQRNASNESLRGLFPSVNSAAAMPVVSVDVADVLEL